MAHRCFIYLVTDENSLPRYVGKAVSVRYRFAEHRKIHQWAVQVFVIEEVKTPDTWQEREKFWIAYYSMYFTLENKTPGGNGSGPWSEARKQRKRQSKRSKEAIEAHRQSMKDRGPELEADRRQRISQTLKRNSPRSSEVYQRIAESRKRNAKPSPLKGIPRTDEVKQKVSLGHARRRKD